MINVANTDSHNGITEQNNGVGSCTRQTKQRRGFLLPNRSYSEAECYFNCIWMKCFNHEHVDVFLVTGVIWFIDLLKSILKFWESLLMRVFPKNWRWESYNEIVWYNGITVNKLLLIFSEIAITFAGNFDTQTSLQAELYTLFQRKGIVVPVLN